jgi:RNA polymerase sigma-70 factor (ECF subfamily)
LTGSSTGFSDRSRHDLRENLKEEVKYFWPVTRFFRNSRILEWRESSAALFDWTLPMPAPSEDVTRLLLAWSEGDKAALDRLMPLVYSELHNLAEHYLRRERSDHSLQATALVNEAYLRLIDVQRVRWENRTHFFAISARLLRQILVDDLAALDEAIKKLAEIDPRKSQVVELRFFGGLSVEEAAEVLEVSPETVKRDWRFAKSWLKRQLCEGDSP